ncbi:MAG: WD40 repeat domain-containing protein [Bacteroidota bacterium]
MKEVTLEPVSTSGLLIDQKDQPVLFNRNNEIEALKRKLHLQHIISLIGNSQSGKSFLVKYGLVPRLNGVVEGQNGKEWHIAITRPGISPIQNLAHALARPGVLVEKAEIAVEYSQQLHRELQRDGGAALVDAFQKAQIKNGQAFNLLIIVNRLEDIFRFEDLGHPQKGRGTLATYINALLYAGRKKDVSIYLLLNLQAAFMGRCAEYRGLAEIVNETSYPIAPLPLRNILEELNQMFDRSVPPTEALFQQMIQDIRAHEEDTLLLPKLQSVLNYTIQNWRENASLNQAISLDYYPPIISLDDFLPFQLNKIYERYHDRKDAAAVLANICKAIVQKDGNGLSRRPILLEDLYRLFPTEKHQLVNEILTDFHHAQPTLIEVINPIEIRRKNFNLKDLNPRNTVIDIKQMAVLYQWDTLQNWAHEEAFEADVYKRLFDTAFRRKIYLDSNNNKEITPTEQPPEKDDTTHQLIGELKSFFWQAYQKTIKTSDEKGAIDQEKREEVSLLVQPELGYMVSFDWYSQNRITQQWAERYASSTVYQTSKRFGQSAFEIAMDFLKESEKAEKAANARKEEKKEAIKKKTELIRNVFLALFLLAIVTAAWGFYQQAEAKKSNTNLQLLNFIDALTDAQIILSGTNKVAELKKEIEESTSINSREAVIDYLARENILKLNKKHYVVQNQEVNTEDLYDQLLISIGDLYREENTKGILADLEESREAALSAYDELKKVGDSITYRQYPYAYKTLYAHLEELRERDPSFKAKSSKSHLVHSSLVKLLTSNPAIENEFAFSDNRRSIFVTQDLQETTKTLLQNNSEVSAMTYNQQGTRLLVGGNNGLINYWDLYTRENEELEEVIQLKRKRFSKKKINGSVQFIAPIRNDTYVLAASTNSIVVYDKQGKKRNTFRFSFPITALAINEEADRLLLGSIGRVLIYELDENWWSKKSRSFRPVPSSKIIFADSQKKLAISAIGVSTVGIDGKDLIALGSEVGDLWILSRFPQGNQYFKECDYHFNKQMSTITSLAFNTTGQQLASSSLDGTVILWNVTAFNDDDEHIQLKENGHGIWTLIYKNDLELVMAENIFLNILYSQTESLKKSLERKAGAVQTGDTRE